MEGKNLSSFGDILFRERNKRGMSLKELADYIGVDKNGKYLLSPSYLNRLEKKEAANPSFKNVCLIIRKLSLDLNEVLLSFGFSDLILTSKNIESNKIENIIRLNDIMAPLFQDGGCIILEHHLDLYEKETLISIINIIFSLGVCTEDRIFHNIIEVIRKTYIYRKNRQEKVNVFFEEKENVIWDDVPKTDFKISINERLKKQIDKYGIDVSDIYMVIEKHKDNLDYIDGKFTVKDKDKNMLLELKKKDYFIKVVSIDKN